MGKVPYIFRCVATKTRADGSSATSAKLVISWQTTPDPDAALRETLVRITNFGWRVRAFRRATVADERELWGTLPPGLASSVQRWWVEVAPYVQTE